MGAKPYIIELDQVGKFKLFEESLPTEPTADTSVFP